MSLANSATRYGSLARSLHWLTALLILSAIGLGLYGEDLPFDSSDALATKAWVYSLHKTIGVTAFFVALLRILWAIIQPRPAPLHPDRRLENLLAEVVHWSLYLSMLLMPLSGWVHHAAVDGFAPILWPFGQGLPFVPKSEAVAQAATALHGVMSKVLIGSVLLHVLGAVKHAVIDRDVTLARMVTGAECGRPGAAHPLAGALIAVAVYTVGAGAVLALLPGAEVPQAAAPATAPTTGNWQVQQGTLGLTVRQMGAPVSGSLANWAAEISFDETPVAGRNGSVRVQIDTTSLTLGSVTDQARGPEFFDTATHPQALFTADILPTASGYEAKGSLTLRGVTVPVTLPFTLQITGDSATMQGSLTLDRRAFGMGASYGDESSVGFGVEVTVALTALRQR